VVPPVAGDPKPGSRRMKTLFGLTTVSVSSPTISLTSAYLSMTNS
jgi:hypothetical protein